MSEDLCLVNPKGLEDVVDAIGTLKADGGQIDPHRLWKVGEHDRRYGKTTKDVSRFDAMVAAKQRLKGAQEILAALQRSVDICLTEVDETLGGLPSYAWYRGMHNVPNEILAVVFECAYDMSLMNLEQPRHESEPDFGSDNDFDSDCENYLLQSNSGKIYDTPLRTVITLAHVSQRFRAIVSRLPRLWSRISMSYRPPVVDLLLKCSGKAELTVVLSSAAPYSRYRGAFPAACDAFLTKMLPHVGRIKDIQFCFGEYDGYGMYDPERIFGILKRDWFNIDLPKLESMSVSLPYIEDDDEFDEEIYIDIRDFYKTWGLPSIRCLNLKNFISTFPTPKSVTQCTIASSASQDLNLHAFLQFLRVSPSLESLTLIIKGYRSFDHEETPVRMPNLQSLTIEVRPANEISKMLDMLKLPKLEKLSVKLELRREEELSALRDENNFSSYFPGLGEDGSIIKSLSIVIRKKSLRVLKDLDGKYLAEFISSLPGLDELCVEARYTSLPIWSYLPQNPIRCLRLKNCDLFPISFLRHPDLVDTGLEDHVLSKLEVVEVIHCPSMAKEELERLLAGKRFIWKS